MNFDPLIFWNAFDSAGLLVDAVFQPEAGDAITVKVGFKRPDQIVLDGLVHSTDYSIEYPHNALPLTYGSLLVVDGKNFRVRQEPLSDGIFTRAQLEEVVA